MGQPTGRQTARSDQIADDDAVERGVLVAAAHPPQTNDGEAPCEPAGGACEIAGEGIRCRGDRLLLAGQDERQSAGHGQDERHILSAHVLGQDERRQHHDDQRPARPGDRSRLLRS